MAYPCTSSITKIHQLWVAWLCDDACAAFECPLCMNPDISFSLLQHSVKRVQLINWSLILCFCSRGTHHWRQCGTCCLMKMLKTSSLGRAGRCGCILAVFHLNPISTKQCHAHWHVAGQPFLLPSYVADDNCRLLLL